jgi:hypothetical protein
MGFWKELKIWQKAGAIVAIAYFLVYFVLLYLTFHAHGETGVGYLLLFMQWPWVWVFWLIGYEPITFIGLTILGITCAFLSGSVVMALGWFLTAIFQNVQRHGNPR